MANQEETRFRSFAERYVIERANTFKVGSEDSDGWEAIQRANPVGSVGGIGEHILTPTEAYRSLKKKLAP